MFGNLIPQDSSDNRDLMVTLGSDRRIVSNEDECPDATLDLDHQNKSTSFEISRLSSLEWVVIYSMNKTYQDAIRQRALSPSHSTALLNTKFSNIQIYDKNGISIEADPKDFEFPNYLSSL